MCARVVVVAEKSSSRRRRSVLRVPSRGDGPYLDRTIALAASLRASPQKIKFHFIFFAGAEERTPPAIDVYVCTGDLSTTQTAVEQISRRDSPLHNHRCVSLKTKKLVFDRRSLIWGVLVWGGGRLEIFVVRYSSRLWHEVRKCEEIFGN